LAASSFSVLCDFLVAHYDDLRRRLTQRLGNADMARDALQDTYVRLQERTALSLGGPVVAQPAAYLYRMAFHLAVDQERASDRRLSADEAEAMLDLADPAPGPDRIAESRSDLRWLEDQMGQLPARQREILLGLRLDGLTREELAARHRISLRTVDRELEKAYAFCDQQLREHRGQGVRP